MTIYGGAVVTDAGGLDIEGNLDLQDDATFMATIGADASRVDVTGTASLGGTLQVVFADGLAVEVGDQWIIATAASFQGAFADVLWPALPGIGFEAVIDPTLFPDALVVQAVQAVPLPAPVFLLFGACLATVQFRRRRYVTI